MIKHNKVYITNFPNKTYHISYTLDEAINNGIRNFEEKFFNVFSRMPHDYQELYKFIEDSINEDDQIFMINIISGNRISFDTSKELIEYFNDNIDKISLENLYEFLLSLVESHDVFYNYKGERVNSDIESQRPVTENVWCPYISFTEDSCQDGKYKFIYHIIGEGEKGRNTF